jgi:cytoskeletal protein CcmA (bactofilin family)
MAQNYTRQSSFSDGDTITAALFNNEYNQLVNVFAYSSSSASSTGHRHDGSAGQGGNIFKIGDLDFLNKIEVDSTNNRLGFYVEVSSSAVEQIRVQDGALVPVTDSDVDIGTSSLYFKDAFIDSITTTGNVSVGGNLDVTGTIDFSDSAITNVGSIQLDSIAGDADSNTSITFSGSDVITIAAGGDNQVTFTNGAIVPSTDNDIDLGTSSVEFKDAFFDGTVTTDALVADTADINGGTVDGAVIGGSSAAAITGTTITGTSFVIGSADISEAELETIDGVTAGTVAASKAVVVDSNKDIGSFRNITLTGELDAATLDISGDADIDGTLETDALSINGTAVTSTAAELNILDGVTASAADINLIDGITNGTVIASKAIITDANKDITGGRNITISGELDAATLDISGDADIDGTLEADAITIGGVTLAETISDTVGAMVTSNTETGITVTYDDSDNTLDFVIGTLNQDTTGTAELATTVTVSANNSTDETIFPVFVDGATGAQGLETDTGFTYNPSSGNLVIGGSLTAASLDISGDVDVDGTLEADAITVNGTTLAETISDTVGAMVTSNTETGVTVTYDDSDNTLDFVIGTLNQDTTGNAATATALETARTIHGVSFDGTANIDLSEVIQDTVGAMVSSNTESGITVAYEDSDGTLDFTVGTLNQDTTGTAALATQVTISANNSTDETIFPVFVDGATGSQGLETDTGFTYNPSTGLLTATGFSGNLTGTLQTAAQTNITSVGTLSTLTVSGDVTVDTNTLKVDSSNNRVGILNASPDVTLDVGSATDAIHVPVGTTAQRPTGAAGYFRYNSTTGGFEGFTDSWGAIAGGGAGSSSTFAKNTFAGDGSTTAFTLTTSMTNEDGLIVFIDGVYQADNVYSVSGTTLTFATAPVNGRVIEVFQLEGGIVGVAPVIATMTGDGSDTTLALGTSPDSENQTFVTIDGVVQHKDTYSISGSTLTFSAAPPNGTKVEAIIFNNVSVATFQDADGDTKIQLEESTDEDTIRMDIAGTEVLTLTNSAMTLKGTTPTLTIGDAGAEDTKIVFDGNAQDFYIGLDDSADDLIIGKGSTVGTTPAIVIDENQKVGIGDTPDLGALHVKTADSGASADSGADEFVLENSGDTGMTILSGTTSSGSIRFGDSEDNDNGIIIYNHGSTPYMRFFSNGSEAVRILNNQHLIAGTTTEYTGTVGNITAARQIDIGADDANLKTLFFNRNAAEGEIGGIASGITGFSTMGRINFVAENVSGGTQASSIRFKVTNSANEREVLRITEDGNFRPAIDAGFAGHSDIGTTSFRFEDAFIRDGVTTGSDRNEKENITESDLGLTFIKELNPVSYSWKNNTSNRTHYGLIAQDIETWLSDNGKNNTDFAALIKEDISEEQDGSNYKYGLRYTEFVSPLIKAIQEQQVIIEDLKARITTLEGG